MHADTDILVHVKANAVIKVVYLSSKLWEGNTYSKPQFTQLGSAAAYPQGQ